MVINVSGAWCFVALALTAIAATAEEGSRSRIPVKVKCEATFIVPHGWSFVGGLGLSPEAVAKPVPQTFAESGAQLTLGSWMVGNTEHAKTIEEWVIQEIGTFAEGHTARISVIELPSKIDGTSHSLRGPARQRFEIEYRGSGEVLRQIAYRVVVIDKICDTPIIVTLAYFPRRTESRRREWYALQDQLIDSLREERRE
jgi:hypothetical protein